MSVALTQPEIDRQIREQELSLGVMQAMLGSIDLAIQMLKANPTNEGLRIYKKSMIILESEADRDLAAIQAGRTSGGAT